MTVRKKDLCVAKWVLLLEEFNYTVEHRPRKNMSHVDALSRNLLPIAMIKEENKESIMVRLKKAQAKDKDLREIRDNIEQHVISGFILKNGILYKEVDDQMLVVVPKSMHMQVLQAHERDHFGDNKTEAIVRRNFWFKCDRILKSAKLH